MQENKPNRLSAMPRRNPTSGTFELTVRCNLHCKMCLFRHADCENSDLMAKELTAAQWIDMAAQAAKAGTINLLITGGEPMLRPDFREIWEGIYKQGFLITLYTNATLVTPEIMETLRKYPPHKIGVTVYGASPETYDAVCGSGKAFQMAMDGVRQLLTLPSILDFRTTIIRDNYHDVGNIEKLIHREFGEAYMLTQTRSVTKAVRGGCADVESCRLSPADNVRLAYRRSIDLIKEYVGDAYDESKVVLERRERDCLSEDVQKPRLTLFGCEAGMHDYTISWDGQLLGCQMMGVFHTDAIGDGLQKAWEVFPLTVQLPPVNEKCRVCTDKELCNCCVASRYAETGILGGLPEYVCKDVSIVKSMLDKKGN